MRGTSPTRRHRPSGPFADPPAKPAPSLSRRPSVSVLVVCLFVSGATALVYEVVWLRMLGLVFGHTVHALTTILAAFMGGLGLGSYVCGRRTARIDDPVRAYGLLEIGIG